MSSLKPRDCTCSRRHGDAHQPPTLYSCHTCRMSQTDSLASRPRTPRREYLPRRSMTPSPSTGSPPPSYRSREPSATRAARSSSPSTPPLVQVRRVADDVAAEAQTDSTRRLRKRLMWRRLLCLLAMMALSAIVIVVYAFPPNILQPIAWLTRLTLSQYRSRSA